MDEDRPGKSYAILAAALQSYEGRGPEGGNVEDMLRGRGHIVGKDGGRFLLVEENLRGSEPGVYFTRHDSLEEALTYNHDQEYGEDWGIVEVVDLLDGSHWKPRNVRITADWEQVG